MDKRKDIIEERSKERLKKEVRKKIQTTMIGALSKIEDHFGYLWGHGEDQITREQEEYKYMFEELRTKILDNGNAQIRNIESEIDTYDVVWNKYHLTLPIRPL
jgi:hypothetical protein